jgi:hydroxymethylpyrimidine/phosphomethylpyrimidine kinase
MSDLRAAKQGPPVVLSIAGSDNSAGAGIQADLKAFTAMGCYGLTAVTCVVAEVPGHVYDIQAVNRKLLGQQISSCFEAFPVAAVKTGMLYSEGLIREVAQELRKAASSRSFQLVVDPVMVASSGDPLLRPGAIRLYWREIFPLAALITPNLDELSFLVGRHISSIRQMRDAGRELLARTGVPVLCKGGHLRGSEAVDLLITTDRVEEFRSPYVRNAETHGTGCTLSAAIAAGLSSGLDLPGSIAEAKQRLTNALQNAHRWGNTRALAFT